MSSLQFYWPTLLLGLVTLVVIIFGLVQYQIIRKQTQLLQSDLTTAWESVQKKRFKKEVILEKQKLAETVVDRGSSTVQSVHKVVSDLTFEILESIPTTKGTSKIVRKVHDKTSSSVYQTVRTVNRQIGEISNELLKTSTHKKPTDDKIK